MDFVPERFYGPVMFALARRHLSDRERHSGLREKFLQNMKSPDRKPAKNCILKIKLPNHQIPPLSLFFKRRLLQSEKSLRDR